MYITIPTRLKRHDFLFSMVFILMGVMVTRGIFEIAIAKGMAMQFHQLLITGILFLLPCLFGQKRLTKMWKVQSILCLLFIAIAWASCIITTHINGFLHWPIYLLYNIFIMLTLLVIGQLTDDKRNAIPFQKIVLFSGMGLLLFSTLEQLHVLSLPGSSIYLFQGFRSGSLTGSYLHYPIVIAVMAFITLQWYVVRKEKIYLIGAILFSLAPFAVLSRSGIFIILATWGIVLGKQIFKRLVSMLYPFKPTLKPVLVMIALTIALFVVVQWIYTTDIWGEYETLRERMLNPTAQESAGNRGRYQKWVWAAEKWLESNLLFGEYTGMVTNSTSHVVGGEKMIVESGFFQQLLNFGFVGTLLYYLALVVHFFRIRPKHTFLRVVYFVCLLQTFVYQSIEVTPFMMLLILLPWVSMSYENELLS